MPDQFSPFLRKYFGWLPAFALQVQIHIVQRINLRNSCNQLVNHISFTDRDALFLIGTSYAGHSFTSRETITLA
jgi:hypothetical protein